MRWLVICAALIGCTRDYRPREGTVLVRTEHWPDSLNVVGADLYWRETDRNGQVRIMRMPRGGGGVTVFAAAPERPAWVKILAVSDAAIYWAYSADPAHLEIRRRSLASGTDEVVTRAAALVAAAVVGDTLFLVMYPEGDFSYPQIQRRDPDGTMTSLTADERGKGHIWVDQAHLYFIGRSTEIFRLPVDGSSVAQSIFSLDAPPGFGGLETMGQDEAALYAQSGETILRIAKDGSG
jgi:hypothetical protein